MNLENFNEYRQPQVGDQIYKELLKYIMDGQIKSGEFLPINTLSEKLNVSNTPIREAFGKLSNDGILRKIPYKGYKVREFNEKSISDIYESRAAIESFACKLITRKISESEINDLFLLQDKGEKYLEEGDLERYKKYNEKLHNELVLKTKNNQLINMYKRIDQLVNLLASQTVNISGRPQIAVKEHRNIINNIKKGNANRASKIMENHILYALEDYKREK